MPAVYGDIESLGGEDKPDMKITCQSQHLKEILKLTSRGVKKTSPIPILQSIKISTDNDLGLTLKATDYDLEITCSMGCHLQELGAVTVPAKQFLEIVGAAAGSEVTITTDENLHVQIKSARSRHKLYGINPTEFPSLPETKDAEGLVLPTHLLRDMFAKVLHAVSKDETRPGMTGALLAVNGDSARIASTDTYRLSVYDLAFDGDTGRNFSALIPKRTLTEMQHFLAADDEDEEVELRVDESQIEFRTRLYMIKSRLLPSQFPNIDKVIDLVGKNECVVSVLRNPLIEALKRMDIVARDDAHRIKWEVSGRNLLLSAQALDLGESGEDVDLYGASTPEDMAIWFRVDQMLDALQAFDSEVVTFVYQSAQRPLLMFPPDGSYFEILMPVVAPDEGGGN
jgi:DNA polymerase-3 subunit beta